MDGHGLRLEKAGQAFSSFNPCLSVSSVKKTTENSFNKKILVPCLDVTMIAFSRLVLEVWSFTVYFSGKRRSLLHQNTAQESFLPLKSHSKKTLRTNVPKSVRKYKRNVLMPPGHPIILLKSN